MTINWLSRSIQSRPRRYWRNLIQFALLSVLIGLVCMQYIGVPFFLSYGLAHPQRLPVCCYTPADLGLVYEDVRLVTRDGLTLRGWYLPAQNGAAVILLHPIASNRMGTLDHARMLARHGYGALLLDIRAHGESDGEVLPFGGPEAEDVRAAAAWLQARPEVDPARVGLLGLSLGSQVGLIGAADVPAVQAVVAEGGGATTFEDWPPPETLGGWFYVPFDTVFYALMPWRTGVPHPKSILSAMTQIAPRPVLLIAAGGEERALRRFQAAGGPTAELWVIPEAGHIAGLNAQPEAYERRVTAFFDQALPAKSGAAR